MSDFRWGFADPGKQSADFVQFGADFVRFGVFANQTKSDKISASPSGRPLLGIPDKSMGVNFRSRKLRFSQRELAGRHGHPNISFSYVSWGPIFLALFFRSSARDPTIEAKRGTIAIKGLFDN